MKSIKVAALIGALVLLACKERKVVESVKEPTRSDYIVAANYAYLLATDSASKVTARLILDEGKFPIRYKSHVTKRFDFLKGAEREGLGEGVKYQVRYMLSEAVQDLYLESSKFMSVSETDDPKDYVSRTIMIQHYLDPKISNLQTVIVSKLEKGYRNSTTEYNWKLVNDLYSNYYPNDSAAEIQFNTMALSAAYLFVNQARMQEDSVKKYYQNWDNLEAITTMNYINKNK